jgi:hypothetical protein
MFRNVILQALGAQSEVAPVTGPDSFAPGRCGVCFAATGFQGSCALKIFSRFVVNSQAIWRRRATID